MDPSDGLWRCPRCGNGFVTKNMAHSCGVFALDDLFAGRPETRRLFDSFLTFARRIGPFEVIPQKTRVSFLAKTRFAGVEKPTKDGLPLRIGLPRRIESPRIENVDQFEPWYVHYLRLTSPAEFDDELLSWLRESYQKMGLRKHLTPRKPGARRRT